MGGSAVIVETRHAGHTVGFAAEFADAFAQAGFDTTLALNAAGREQAELREVLAETPGYRVDWLAPFRPDFASVEQGLAELRMLDDLAARLRPERLIVPTGDAVAKALVASGDARAIESRLPRMDIVVHHVAAAYFPSGRATLKRWRQGLAEYRALRRHRVMTCDAYVGRGPGRRAAAVSGVRPVDLPHLLRKESPWSRTEARAHFEIEPEARVLVSVGDVAHRKGIDRLIAAATLPGWPSGVSLLLAGPVSE